MQTHAPRTNESDADSILIVLDPEDPAATMRTALPYAADLADEVHLLLVYPDETVEHRHQAHAEARTNAPVSITQLHEEAERVAREIGREYLGEDADFDALGVVGRRAPHIAAAAKWTECTHVYVANEEDRPLDRLRRFLDRPTGLASALPDGVGLVDYDELVGGRTDREVGIDAGAGAGSH